MPGMFVIAQDIFPCVSLSTSLLPKLTPESRNETTELADVVLPAAG